MFGYFYSHIYLKITAKPQIPFLKEMVFVNELFFWLKKKVKKIHKIESNLTPQVGPFCPDLPQVSPLVFFSRWKRKKKPNPEGVECE